MGVIQFFLISLILIITSCSDCELQCEKGRTEGGRTATPYSFVVVRKECGEICSGLFSQEGASNYKKRFFVVNLKDSIRTEMTEVMRSIGADNGLPGYFIDGNKMTVDIGSRQVDGWQVHQIDLKTKKIEYSTEWKSQEVLGKVGGLDKRWSGEGQWITVVRSNPDHRWSELDSIIAKGLNWHIIDLKNRKVIPFDPNKYFETDTLYFFDDLWSTEGMELGLVVQYDHLILFKKDQGQVSRLEIPFADDYVPEHETRKGIASFDPDYKSISAVGDVVFMDYKNMLITERSDGSRYDMSDSIGPFEIHYGSGDTKTISKLGSVPSGPLVNFTGYDQFFAIWDRRNEYYFNDVHVDEW